MLNCLPAIRQEIEKLYSMDGDGTIFSVKDYDLAVSEFCGDEQEKYQLSKYICDTGGKIAGNFDSIANRIEELFRNQSCTISPENPINKVLEIEQNVSSKEDVKNARQILNDILNEVNKRLNDGQKRAPEKCLKLVYNVILEHGISWSDNEVTLLTQGLRDKQLDCDTSSFIIMAVAYEFGWPISLIEVPGHMFVRWNEGLMSFNMEYGEALFDNVYKKEFKIESDDLAVSCDMVGVAYFNRGCVRSEAGRYKEAIGDFEMMAGSNPNSADAYCNLGIAKVGLGRHEEAIKDYNRAIKLNPNAAMYYNNRGIALVALGRLEEAVRSFKRALMVDPDYENARKNLVVLGQLFEIPKSEQKAFNNSNTR